jgi:hypothetical protein
LKGRVPKKEFVLLLEFLIFNFFHFLFLVMVLHGVIYNRATLT